MVNLIPHVAKKSIAKEYWVRVFSIWLFLITIAFLVTTSLLIPTYVLIQGQVNAYRTEAEEIIVKADAYNLSSASLIKASQQATELIKIDAETPFSNIITVLSDLPKNGVEIISYEFTREASLIGPITLEGTATTRQSLADFRETLLEHPQIEKIELPISNLALDRDISFSVTITLKQSTTTTSL